LLLALIRAPAEKQIISREQPEALVSGLKFQQGEIALDDGLATLHMPGGFRFLYGPDSKTLVVKSTELDRPTRDVDALIE